MSARNSTFDNSTTIYMRTDLSTSTIILITLSAVICVCGFLGNITIAAIILKCKKMQTATNWFVFNLAVCDLAIVIITIPFNLIHQFINWPFGLIGCKYLLMPVMEHLACVCVLTHTAISLVRYTIISRGGIRGVISIKFARFVICIIWLLSFLVLSAPLMGFLGEFYLERYSDVVICKLNWISVPKKKIYRVGVFIITYVIPMVTTGYSYCKIHLLVIASLKNVNSLLTKNMRQTRRRKARQMDTTLMRMYAMFAVITLPLQLFLFLHDFDMIPPDSSVNLRLTFDLLMNLFYTQILSNPLVLLYMGDEYRKQMRHLKLCCCFFVPRIRKLSQKLEGSFRNMYRRKTECTEMSLTENFNERSTRSMKFSFRKYSGKNSPSGGRAYDMHKDIVNDYSCFSKKINRRSSNDFSKVETNRLAKYFFENTKLVASTIDVDIFSENIAQSQPINEEKNNKLKKLCVIYEASSAVHSHSADDNLPIDTVVDRESIL